MEVRLVVERGGRRQVCRLGPPRAVIGRARGNAVRIPSAQVSRQHCRLMLEDGLVYLEDLNSINGTQLNGRPVRDLELVRPGDRLGVGPIVFTVEYELTTEALDRLRRQAAPVGMPMFAEMDEVLSVEDDAVEPDLEFELLEPPARWGVGDDQPIQADFDDF